MSTFWLGVIILVLILETVRISISAGVLLYVLRGVSRQGPAQPDMQRREREFHRPAVLDAVREAMEEVATGQSRRGVARAIDELDRYVGQLAGEQNHR